MNEWMNDRKSKCVCLKYLDMTKFWLSVSHKHILIFYEPSTRIFNSLLSFIIWNIYCKQHEWPFRVTNSHQSAWNYSCFSTASPSSLRNPSGQGKLGQFVILHLDDFLRTKCFKNSWPEFGSMFKIPWSPKVKLWVQYFFQPYFIRSSKQIQFWQLLHLLRADVSKHLKDTSRLS